MEGNSKHRLPLTGLILPWSNNDSWGSGHSTFHTGCHWLTDASISVTKLTTYTHQHALVDTTLYPQCCPQWVTSNIHPISHVPHDPLCESMTSSTKPEVHNILHRHQEDWATAMGNVYRKLCEVWKCGLWCMQVDRYMDKQTDTQTHIQTRLSQYFAPLPATKENILLLLSTFIERTFAGCHKCAKYSKQSARLM